MYINSQKENDITKYLEVLNLDTGEFLRGVTEANQETGEYTQYGFDPNGLITRTRLGFDINMKKGNIVFVYKGE